MQKVEEGRFLCCLWVMVGEGDVVLLDSMVLDDGLSNIIDFDRRKRAVGAQRCGICTIEDERPQAGWREREREREKVCVCVM